MTRYIIERSNDEIGYQLRGPKTKGLRARTYALREGEVYGLYEMIFTSGLPIAKVNRFGRSFTRSGADLRTSSRLTRIKDRV